MLPYIAEFLGTMIMILLGDSGVANVTLNKSAMNGGGAVIITLGWGFAVMIPALIFGEASGASFNPALTLALAVGGSFPWAMVPGYIISQIAGAFAGGCLMYLAFKDHLDATENPRTQLVTFTTCPSIPSTYRNMISEFLGSFVLVFTILGMEQIPDLNAASTKIIVFSLITSIGMSFGGLTGYAINPARDLGPRLAHALLPMKHKGSSNFRYGLIVPIISPIVGALTALGVYRIIPW